MSAPPSSIASALPTDLKRSNPHPFDPAIEVPSQAGKVILITGATAGIGKQTALDLAKHGPAQIWVSGRTERGVVDDIKTVSKEVNVRFLEMDLADFSSVKKAARIILAEAKKIDILMLNAGTMGGAPGLTPSGYEKQFGTNHMGHALFLKLLLPLLDRTASSRVIFTSSRGHAFSSDIAFSTLKSPQTELSGVKKYTQSKLANVIYARQVSLHYPNIISVAIHPEDVATELFSKGAVGGGPEIEYLAKEIAPKVGVSVEEGAKNGLWAATAEGVESGRYYEPVGVLGKGSELSRDEEIGKRLWQWTEKELENFGI